MKKQRCHKCGKEKPIFDFHKDCTRKTGYKTICKVCSKQYQRTVYSDRVEKEGKSWTLVIQRDIAASWIPCIETRPS